MILLGKSELPYLYVVGIWGLQYSNKEQQLQFNMDGLSGLDGATCVSVCRTSS